MSTTKALIVDDEISGYQVLEELISRQHSDIDLIPSARTIADAALAIDLHRPDLVFLDIKLGNQLAFELFDKTGYKDYHVIFVTAYSEYALQAIKASALDYLLKPVNRKELNLAIIKFKERRVQSLNLQKIELLTDLLSKSGSQRTNKISLPTTTGYELIPLDEVLYLIADRNYCRVFLKNGEAKLATKHLGAFDEQLAFQHFVRIHKSAIVNTNEVRLYSPGNGGFVKMTNGERLEVSRRRRKELLELLDIQTA